MAVASPTTAFGDCFDDTIASFLDLVEASTHYRCVKRAWVEFLGEPPDPAVDRVDT